MLGKTRREEALALLGDYVSRIKHFAEIEVITMRDAGPSTLWKLKIDPAAAIVYWMRRASNSRRNNSRDG